MFLHHPGYRLAEEEKPLQVQILNRIPLLFIHFKHRGVHTGAGGIYQYINFAEFRYHLVNQARYLVHAADMSRYRQRLLPQSPYLIGYLFQAGKPPTFNIPGGYRYIGTGFGECYRRCLAYAATTAGNQRHFSFE